MESFYTIQGEGYHKGTAAYFVRIGGCDIGCHWCDVKESWDPNIHPPLGINKIVSEVRKKSDLVVITGGEPLIYDMSKLTDLLLKNNVKTHIETSGAYKLTGKWNWICLSPKKNKLPLNDIYTLANELKVEGYNPTFHYQSHNKLHLVALGEFEKEDVARNAMAKARRSGRKASWLKKLR